MVRLTVLYGSQTGNAEEVAYRIADEASRRRFGTARHGSHGDGLDSRTGSSDPRNGHSDLVKEEFVVDVYSLETYPRQALLEEDIVVFVVSTTGNGDPPDTMRQFWRFLLRKNLPSDCLSHLRFSVFGLGDSSYVKYNFVAKKLRNRLLQLGGQEVARCGFGDDQSVNGLEGDLDNWLQPVLWSKLLLIQPLPDGFIVDDSPRLFSPVHHPESLSISSLSHDFDSLAARIRVLSKLRPQGCYDTPCLQGTVVKNQRITAPDWEQDVRHVEISVANDACPEYGPGDIAILYPENTLTDKEFEAFCGHLGLNPNDWVSGIKLAHIPESLSVRELFTVYLDILGTPRRKFFESCYFFTTDSEEKEKMLELCSPEGNDIFHAYCKKERKSYFDVLCGGDFKTCRPPLEYLLEMIPRLEPREYSIASARNEHGNNMVHLTIAALVYLTPWKRRKIGVASKWVLSSDFKCGKKVLLYVKKGTLSLPSEDACGEPKKPLILIGPGTGVAPMRSLIYARKSPRTFLYFGCRSKSKDFYYEDEWKKLMSENLMGELRTAFSRDTPGRKIYVQSLIAADSDEICRLLVEEGGYCYISGSANRMPAEVREEIVKAIDVSVKVEGFGDKFVRQMEQKGKFKIESWS